MRFPSIAALAGRARDVLLRFPWVLACGVVAVCAAIVSIDNHSGSDFWLPGTDFWLRLMMVALLGFPLAVALTLLAEWRGWTGWKKTGLLGLSVVGLALFFEVWPGPEQKHEAIRYFQLSAGLHLLVAFLPFVGRFERRAFWQYNRYLFEAFLRAVLFSVVLFVGLVIALAALDKLLGVHVPSATYFRVWCLIAFGVNTWIFLGGVPDNPAMLEEDSYPRGLKVFTQYILTPLVAVYLVILTLYLIKIVISGSWPSGWIGYLVSSVAVTGLLGFLLVHPLRTGEGEGWIRTYTRWLFIGLIPAAAMFLLALGKRIDPYGLTELRVVGMLLGAWLFGIAVLYTVRRDFGIRIIPISLAIVLLVTLFGPLSVTQLSLRSQTDRLHALLLANHLIGERRKVASGVVPENDKREISAVVRFLLERHAMSGLERAFGGKLAGLEPYPVDKADVDSVAHRIMAAIDVEYVPRYAASSGEYFSLSRAADSTALGISGYDYVAEISATPTTTYVDGDTIRVLMDTVDNSIRLTESRDTVIRFPLAGVLDSMARWSIRSGKVGAGRLRVLAEGKRYRGMLVFDWFSGDRKSGTARIRTWRGSLYLGRLTGEPVAH